MLTKENVQFLELFLEMIKNKNNNQINKESNNEKRENLTLNEYQIIANKTDIYPENTKYLCHILGVAGESGELLNKVKKIYRDDNGKLTKEKSMELAYEVGDILWYVSAISKDLGLTLEELALLNLNKLKIRNKNNTLHGSGDNR